MPELPEVETVRRQLASEVVGAEIVEIEVRVPKIFVGNPPSIYRDKITAVTRTGKYLFLHLLSGKGVVIHLKMTGRLILNVPEYALAPHTRVALKLSDGRYIYYWDTRMFGYLRVEEGVGEAINKLKEKMGKEPWEITDTEFLRKLQKTGRAIKEVILDQSILAGVGNIYANDGLWMAGINPKRRANGLRLTEAAKLRESLCSVLERGLSTGGASDNTYRDFYGGRGSYQNEFLVYGRTGEPCRKCGSSLERIVVGGRGSWVCSECQK